MVAHPAPPFAWRKRSEDSRNLSPKRQAGRLSDRIAILATAACPGGSRGLERGVTAEVSRFAVLSAGCRQAFASGIEHPLSAYKRSNNAHQQVPYARAPG